MSLFDDDFYSTKVSKRLRRRAAKLQLPFHFRFRFRGHKWSTIQIALLSSIASSAIVVLLFVLIVGGIRGGDLSSTASGVDPSERAIYATSKVRPAVVSIINEQTFALGAGGRKSGGKSENGNGVLREAGVGSGVIVEKKGGKAYIITNHHVIADAEKVKAVLTNGESREARIVGSDQITDLAVLEIDGKGIHTVAEIGDSSTLRAAEFVMAMGNPLGMGESITLGIVSVIREVVPVSLGQNGIMDWEQEVIRVDAAINEGNSGGPLIDLNGKVVGINSMKIADFGVESIGYAIPINNAMPIVESIISKGYVPRPYLGVYTIDLEQYWSQQDLQKWLEEEQPSVEEEASPDSEQEGDSEQEDENESDDKVMPKLHLPDEVFSGVIVLEAVGPAQKAGLQYNDVIVKLDKKKIGSTRELRKYLYNDKKIGDSIEVSYYREGKLEVTTLKLGDKAEEE